MLYNMEMEMVSVCARVSLQFRMSVDIDVDVWIGICGRCVVYMTCKPIFRQLRVAFGPFLKCDEYDIS